MKTDPGDNWPGFCEAFFRASLTEVVPSACLPRHLPDPSPYRAVKVIALGKAAAAMAAVVEREWRNLDQLSGVAITRYGNTVKTDRIKIIEAAHPVPDNNSVMAAERALEVARSAAEDELMLVLLSGGGSSLACLPRGGVTFEQKRALTSRLLLSGASIDEINTVRRHLSAIKGGKLAIAARKAQKVLTLAISDVVGDDPATIASGPTVEEQSTLDEARRIIEMTLGGEGAELLRPAGSAPTFPENTEYEIIASSRQLMRTATEYLASQGYPVVMLGQDEVGEARDVAKRHASAVTSWLASQPYEEGAGSFFLSGGELTVTVQGEGMGGPNQEYVLALAEALKETCQWFAFAADTDGVDGSGGATGAYARYDMFEHDTALCEKVTQALSDNDSYRFFNDLKSIFKAKDTMTNVNDLRLIYVRRWRSGSFPLTR